MLLIRVGENLVSTVCETFPFLTGIKGGGKVLGRAIILGEFGTSNSHEGVVGVVCAKLTRQLRRSECGLCFRTASSNTGLSTHHLAEQGRGGGTHSIDTRLYQ